MIDLEVPLPPGKEGFDLPAQLVDQGDLFSGQVKAAGGNPVECTIDRVPDQAQRDVRLIQSLPAEQHLGIRKDQASVRNGI